MRNKPRDRQQRQPVNPTAEAVNSAAAGKGWRAPAETAEWRAAGVAAAVGRAMQPVWLASGGCERRRLAAAAVAVGWQVMKSSMKWVVINTERERERAQETES